jgi:hypothetical protein
MVVDCGNDGRVGAESDRRINSGDVMLPTTKTVVIIMSRPGIRVLRILRGKMTKPPDELPFEEVGMYGMTESQTI